jgi:hypothetical protein
MDTWLLLLTQRATGSPFIQGNNAFLNKFLTLIDALLYEVMSFNTGRTFIYLLISQVFLCFQWAISQNFYTPVSLDLQVGQSIVNQYLEAEQQDYSQP